MKTSAVSCAAMVLVAATVSSAQSRPADATATRSMFAPPVRLEADGKPIDIGRLSKFAHAGPCLADVDGDGKRDLLVGDFPGNFWLFLNTGADDKPVFTGKGRFKAGGVDAKTPVY
jgi:hypothetical protein